MCAHLHACNCVDLNGKQYKTYGRSLHTPNGVFTPEQDNDKTNVEPGVKGIIGMHRFNICLVVVLLWCENTIRVAPFHWAHTSDQIVGDTS